MEGGRSPDHGSLPVAENECLWPRVSYVKAGDYLACQQAHWCMRCTTIPIRCWGLGRHKFSPDSHKWACSHFLCWPSRWSGLRPCHVRTQRTRDRRLALICIAVFILCLVPSFLAVSHCTLHQNPYIWYCKWPHIYPQPRSYLLVSLDVGEGCDVDWSKREYQECWRSFEEYRRPRLRTGSSSRGGCCYCFGVGKMG